MEIASDELAREARDLTAETFDRFFRLFGSEVEAAAMAPGRVNLIGEHIDYNDGHVLPMAIERATVVGGGRLPAGSVSIVVSSSQGEALVREPGDGAVVPGEPEWANYVRGVVAGFLERGIAVPPFRAVVHGDVPAGGGLSSSAALEVATATFLEALTGVALDPRDKALLCQRAEHTFAGVPCGIMDQFASVFARRDHVLLLDCRSLEIRHVPFEDPDVVVVIANTGVHHALADGEYARRRRECEEALALLGRESWRDVSPEDVESARGALGDRLHRRARHVVTEERRTAAAAEALASGRWEALGPLMRDSHRSLRDDYEVSCPELDLLVEIAEGFEGEGGADGAGGVIGARMTGGGFGGSTVTLVRRDSCAALLKALRSRYRAETGREANLILTRPAAGAHPLKVPASVPGAGDGAPSSSSSSPPSSSLSSSGSDSAA